MRIGAICRCDNTGLGIQSKEFFDNIPCSALVVDVSKINNTFAQHHYRYPDQAVVFFEKGGSFKRDILMRFLSNIDVLLTFETAYDHSIFALCREMGIGTALQLNYEFLDYPHQSIAPPDLFISPSLWHYEDIPNPKVYLPVPVNTKHFFGEKKRLQFLHIAGNPAHRDRNGTQILLEALPHVHYPITVDIKCQKQFQRPFGLPEWVKINIDFSDVENYYDLYKCGGTLIMPRKYGGLCLPCNEAIGCSMPVIMPDISPNNAWLPKEWLVPAIHKGSFMSRKEVDVFEVDKFQLAKKIHDFCEDEFYNTAVDKANELKDKISWDALRDHYTKILQSISRR